MITLLGGYIVIVSRIIAVDRPKRTKKIEWDDVNNEFKLFFYNLGKELNRKSSDKSKNTSKKRK